VNVARGPIVVTDDLRAALDGGIVGCASLDVTDPEPLPDGHWLYQHPRVRLSAHVSWSWPLSDDAIGDMFSANLRRFLDGQPLVSVIERDIGY
jgi:phosphoglycerate dehydrogenase-like enzyme